MMGIPATRSRGSCEVCQNQEWLEFRHKRSLCPHCLALVYFEERLAALHGLELDIVTSYQGRVVTAHRPAPYTRMSQSEFEAAARATGIGLDDIISQFTSALRALNKSIAYGNDASTVANGRAFLRLGAKYLAVLDRSLRPEYICALATVHSIVGEKNPALRCDQRSAAMVTIVELHTDIERRIVFQSSSANYVEASTIGLGQQQIRALSFVELEQLSAADFALFVKAASTANYVVNAPAHFFSQTATA